MPWSTVEDAIAAVKRGDFVLVMDSEDREDECDIIFAAETVTAEQMAFAIRHTTGIICIVADQERLERFGLHPATTRNTDANATNFYVSTDFLPATTTGCSAADRATTARAMCNLAHTAEEFSKPGHLFPLCARKAGVLERPGHTESTFDLCRLAGVPPVGLLAELMHDDGTMYRRDASLEFASKHGIPIITVPQLIEYRRQQSAVGAPSIATKDALVVPQPTAAVQADGAASGARRGDAASSPTGEARHRVLAAHASHPASKL
uniref:3,4-dihydroxy-2-butanone 4-phosphate synthase n=1 Tax=Zooxanthella nutricula TaxID=1333877 RepID=A0A6U6XSP7_9DINO|mmetsp:Transcript_99953/g.305530  ORF Transcript_99953/g.305530 Transcript_99953/m.305530 type:complete len:264 (+) Transcript_99953:50-841(+)|eukprot:CAMPEP_0198544160 /NCGR_PEP_ID=MMETSP1462-20131121/60053_1 /TAXON_ID=1333877 /ORGANISM="Brandtodinium nutriculum, Strain RCC3387" /LENGTH=263 /DNA_ID=CAMNT_0044274473 /DNA_START=50 /DNA_END=841 /DNA_ORIENTATION=+